MSKITYKLIAVVVLVVMGFAHATKANTPSEQHSELAVNKPIYVEKKAETQKLGSGFPKELLAAGGCESNHSASNSPKQFDSNGKVITHTNVSRTGKISYDYGAFQINSVHLPEAKKLGLDIIGNEADNYKMALILYKRSGVGIWAGYNAVTKNCSYY